jgi:hypothetical protein
MSRAFKVFLDRPAQIMVDGLDDVSGVETLLLNIITDAITRVHRWKRSGDREVTLLCTGASLGIKETTHGEPTT